MNTPSPSTSRTSGAGGVAALLAATLFWAGNYVVGAAAVSAISPVDLTAMRWAIALIPLLVLAQLTERPDWRHVAKAWPALIGPALFGLIAYNVLLYCALQHTTAVNASLINAFNPALISVAAAVFLRQRLTLTAAGGIAVALIGVLWVLTGGHPRTLLTNGLGVGEVFMLGAITAWTAYTLVGRRNTGQIPPITATAVQACLAVILLSPAVLLTGGPHLPTSHGPLLALLFVGFFPSVISYVMWNKALTTIPPARAGVFLNMITVFAVAISIALGQPFTVAQAIGGLLVITGVILTNLNAFQHPRSQPVSTTNPKNHRPVSRSSP